MAERSRIEPADVVMAVEMYVDDELRDAEKFDNRSPLDDSGVWSLHALAATIYAMGWEDGERATGHKARGMASRRAAPVPHPAATDPSDGGGGRG